MAHNVGSGDKLARGAVRAVYTVRDEVTISQNKWNEMFPKEKAAEVKANYKFNCEEHGIFTSYREFYISGGYPQLNEYAKGKCPTCEGVSEYAGYEVIGGNTNS